MTDDTLELLARRLGEMKELVRQVSAKQQATLKKIESVSLQLTELAQRKGR